MYQKLMHNKSLRLIGGLLGGLLLSVAINVFIVPQGLYGGGAYGLCQVIRTLLQRELSLSLPFDLAGVLYFFVNIPLFLLAYKALGREFFWKAAICTVCNSVFLAVIPSPSTPVIPDLLTSCMVGGILAGFGSCLRLLHRRTGHPGAVSQQEGQPLHRGPALHFLQRAAVHPVLLPVRCHHRDLLRYI